MSTDPSMSVATVMTSIVDTAITHRHARALERAATMKSACPDEAPDALARQAVRRYCQDIAFAGALAGIAGTVPGIGLPAAAVAAVPEMAYLTTDM